jgi:hypothetical protein
MAQQSQESGGVPTETQRRMARGDAGFPWDLLGLFGLIGLLGLSRKHPDDSYHPSSVDWIGQSNRREPAMRAPIALMLTAALAVSAPAAAQDNNLNAAGNTAAPATAPAPDANATGEVPPTDNTVIATTDVVPAPDVAATEDAYETAPAPRRDRTFPWGLLGVLGLVGLLGRRRANR